ncbi:MAG: HAD family hydrolase [Ilumatobacteraceae bacterium]
MNTEYDVIGFDADDTLWQSEDGFRANELRFVELIAPFAPEGVDVAAALTATERKNLHPLGYGVKSFAISMVEAAITISGGTVPTSIIAELITMARGQLEEPVKLLPHVPEVLAKVGAKYRLVLITKGDLVHQTHKITTSGLDHHFDHREIVLEKNPDTYAGLLRRFGVAPSRFLMVGNSVRSDVLPVMAIGGNAVHVPYHLLWELEHVEHDARFTELASLADLPPLLGC